MFDCIVVWKNLINKSGCINYKKNLFQEKKSQRYVIKQQKGSVNHWTAIITKGLPRALHVALQQTTSMEKTRPIVDPNNVPTMNIGRT